MAIPDFAKNNFNELLRAARNGDLCLMQCTDPNGTTRYAICVSEVHEHDKKPYHFTPVGMMCDETMGNPYDYFDPAIEDGEVDPTKLSGHNRKRGH